MKSNDWVKNMSIILLVFGVIILAVSVVKIAIGDFDLLIRSYIIAGLFSVIYPALYIELVGGSE